MSGLTSNPPDPSRSRALKAMAIAVVGGCAAFAGSGLLPFPRINTDIQSQAKESQTSSQATASDQTSFTRVRVRYFQMSSALPGVTEEYFVLPSPAIYSALRGAVTASHPALASMVPGMLVLVDGVVAKDDTQLKNGDEVDLIPTMTGG